jgi:hypothetical protein
MKLLDKTVAAMQKKANPPFIWTQGSKVDVWDFRTGKNFPVVVDKIFQDTTGEYGEAGDWILWYNTQYGSHGAIWDSSKNRWEDQEI